MVSNWIKQKSWSSEDECLDAIPDDWEARQVEDIYTQQDIGRRYDKKSTKSAGATPVIDQSADGFIGWHDSEPGVVATTENPVVTFANHTCEMRLIRHPFSVIQNVFPLKGKTGVCDTRYFYYSTKGIVRLEEYKGHYPQFRERWIGLPPLREQKAIAHILGSLDDKIELNRKTNETLEAMAKALFKSWFVDFDPVRAKTEGRPTGLPAEISDLFPDSFEDSELGEIPSGWNVAELGDISTISGGKQLESVELKSKGRFPVYGANGTMGFHDLPTHNSFVIVFGRVGAYCGSINWEYGGAWVNNNASSVIPLRYNELVLQWMLEADYSNYRTGSAQPFIPNGALACSPVLMPTDALASVFCDLLLPIRLKQKKNQSAALSLAEIRDALLPKLISGEIRIPDAEKTLEEVDV